MGAERRRYQRIPLAVPLFLRGTDQAGKPFLDLTLALNVSGGGALLATRRKPRRGAKLTLEVPTAPLPACLLAMQSKRAMQGRVVRNIAKDAYNLCAVRFTRPLIETGNWKLETRNANPQVTQTCLRR